MHRGPFKIGRQDVFPDIEGGTMNLKFISSGLQG